MPQRGDVAVFKLPTDTNVDYIKRVIGLPGDRIQMKDNLLYINDVPVKMQRIEDYVDQEGFGGGGQPIPQYLETLPNGVSHRILDYTPNGDADNTEVYIVPEGHYFMMGDNRDNSQDSRYQNQVGFVPLENFVGRADVLFFSISSEATLLKIWEWPFKIRWSRLFNLI